MKREDWLPNCPIATSKEKKRWQNWRRLLQVGRLILFQPEREEKCVWFVFEIVGAVPTSEYKPEALYKLYLIFKETDPAKASTYAQLLKEQYPNATVTKILLNPNYLKETSVAAEKQKLLYKEGYAYFQQNNLRAAQENLRLRSR